MRTTWRRIAAIPCIVLAPLLWTHGCSVWRPESPGTAAGWLYAAPRFLPFLIVLVAGCWLWKPLPKERR
jgi:hypothetical protein